ncbi:MAG: DUF302 domain-containing protein [Sulfuriferula sp.]|nr:DUF302 domain-containing protein [Sulfuriferula sp.]
MKTILTSLVLLVLTASLTATAADSNEFAKVYTTKGDFDSVRDSLVTAVEGRGLKINHINHISEMLDRTGKDLGVTTQVYLNAEQIEFCSAVLSRKMMTADPTNIIACPYSIAVYNLPAKPDTIYVVYRIPPPVKDKTSKAIFGDVEKLLNDIIQEGISLAM